MLNYKNFLKQINEGLIITHDLNISISIISKLLDNYNIFYKLEQNEEYKSFKIIIENPINLKIIHYEELFKTINNLGYFQSAYKLYNISNMSKLFKWYNFEDFFRNITIKILKLEIYIESKKDKELNYLPTKLYHLTTDNKVNKILKQGLVPKNNNKKSFHLERIYLIDNLKNVNILLNQFSFNNKLNSLENITYSLLEIDTTNLNIKLYKDPNFKEGYYTEENINKNNIKVINSGLI